MTTVLEKPQETQREAEGTREFLWTTELFYQALEAGVFKEPNLLELIHGRIIQKMPMSPLHADTADYFSQRLQAAMSPLFRVREEKPIHIDFSNELIPDMSVVLMERIGFGKQHPTSADVALVVEVAVTSIDYDLGEKALLYAQAGIGEYWVVVPEARQVWVHREPSPEGYRSIIGLGETEAICPLAAPDTAFIVGDMLGSPVVHDQ